MATASPSGSSDLSPVISASRKPRTDGSSHTAAIFSRSTLTARSGSHWTPPLLPSVTVTSSRWYSRAYTPRAVNWVSSVPRMLAASCHHAVPDKRCPGSSASTSLSP